MSNKKGKHERPQRQLKISGKPKRCTNIPGSGACQKMRKKNHSLCRECTAVGKNLALVGSFNLR